MFSFLKMLRQNNISYFLQVNRQKQICIWKDDAWEVVMAMPSILEDEAMICTFKICIMTARENRDVSVFELETREVQTLPELPVQLEYSSMICDQSVIYMMGGYRY